MAFNQYTNIVYSIYSTFVRYNFEIYNNGYQQFCKEDKRSGTNQHSIMVSYVGKKPLHNNAEFSSETIGEVGLEPDVSFPKEQDMLTIGDPKVPK